MKAWSLLVPSLSLIVATGCSTVREVDSPSARPSDGAARRTETPDALAYDVTLDVSAPADVVWAVLTDAAAYPTWSSTVISLQGAIAKDGNIALVVKDDPERTFELAVSTFDPPTTMVWEDGMPLGLFAGVRTFTLTAVDEKTTRFSMQEVFSGGMLSMIAGELPDFRPSFEAFAKDLKAEAERRAGASAPVVAEPAPPAVEVPPADAPVDGAATPETPTAEVP